MRDKTNFQVKCHDQFLSNVRNKGINLEMLDFVDGKEESYYQGGFGVTRFWIYEDGACIKADKKTKMFESLDYKSEDDLIKDFINSFNIMITEGYGSK